MTNLAFITGGTGGLGSAIKTALLAAGWHVAAPAHSELDVADSAKTPELDKYARRLSAPDAIICAHAAPAEAGIFQSLTWDVYGVLNVLSAFLPRMAAGGGGRVVLFSSIRAYHPRPSQVAYAASKSAVEGLTRGLAVAHARDKILVNCIAPGAIPTPRTAANIAAGNVSEQELIARTPLGRLITAEEVARVALWLASPECPLTGQVITIDGGWSISG